MGPAVALALLLAGAPPGSASNPADNPFAEPGVVPEWQGQPIRPGDQWIKARIDIDRKGRPKRCGVVESNVHDSELPFWMCNAMMQDWHTDPAQIGLPPGQTWVVRTLVMPGRETQKAEDAAKARH